MLAADKTAAIWSSFNVELESELEEPEEPGAPDGFNEPAGVELGEFALDPEDDDPTDAPVAPADPAGDDAVEAPFAGSEDGVAPVELPTVVLVVVVALLPSGAFAL
jgi:hypothetical protein